MVRKCGGSILTTLAPPISNNKAFIRWPDPEAGSRSSKSSRVGLLQLQDQANTDLPASIDESLEWRASTNNGSMTQDGTADEYNSQYMPAGEYGEQYAVQAYNQAAVNDGQDGYAQQEQPEQYYS